MPAFSFEKISSPEPRATATPTAKNPPTRKRRGVVVQVLDRITRARAKRSRKKPTASCPKFED